MQSPICGDDLTVMNWAINQLPVDERQILALYCGAELGISEVAQILEWPVWRVRAKVDGTFEFLRSLMLESGCVWILPLLTRTGLQCVLFQGAPVPDGLEERIFQRIAEMEQLEKLMDPS